jgi:hypothetical protein
MKIQIQRKTEFGFFLLHLYRFFIFKILIMNKILFLLLFLSNLAFSQLPNISFSSNSNWTKPANVIIDNVNNQANITGNGTNFVRTTLNVALTNIPTEFYVLVEVNLSGVNFNNQNIKNPQIVVKNSTGGLLGRINLESGLQNQWFKTGVKISNYTANNFSIEIGINGTTGLMKVKNPVLSLTPPVFIYQFPFDVPTSVASSLNVNLSQKHNFENDLLSTNSHFVYASYQWGSSQLNNAINNYFPMTNYRFPGGTVGNYYNYLTDTFFNNANTPNNLATIAANGYKFNYTGYKDQVVNTGATATLMFNVLTSTPSQSKEEYSNRLSSGLPIKWIEMGNEMYAQGNQTGNITNVASYISHTQQLSGELKSVNPNVKVAVCLEKNDFTVGEWNQTISQNQSYFDAATLHNYISMDSYFYDKYETYTMYKSYKTSMDRFMQYNLLFPTKPLLITEWGITTEVLEPYFEQTLGLADAFLATEKANELGIVKQAGIHMMYKSDLNDEATLMYKGADNLLKLTSKGVMYTKLFEVFKNAEVYNADVASAEIESGLKGVYAKMTKKGTQYKIFAVNKLPVSSPFTLNVDGKNYSGNYILEHYSKDLNNPVAEVNATSNQWVTSNLTGAISLPASSISIITISEKDLNSILSIQNENLSFNVAVYPSPVNSVLHIEGIENKDCKIEILDMFGKNMVKFNKVNNSTIDINGLDTGIYFLKITNENSEVLIKKIIKK